MDNEQYTKIIEKVAIVEQSSKSAHRRLDTLETVINSFHDIASDVKILAKEMMTVKEDVKEIKSKVEDETNRPNRMFNNLKQAVINAIGVIITGAILALIIK